MEHDINDAARFLKELERKARENIVDSIYINNNVVNAVAVLIKDDNSLIDDKLNYFVSFSLNGHGFTFSGRVDKMYPASTLREKISELFSNELNKIIICELDKSTT